jgi:hypothetical protein
MPELRVLSEEEAPVPPEDHLWFPYCGGPVWSWSGVDGQCCLEYGHPGDCEC